MSRKSVKEVSILGTEKRRFPNKHYVYVIQVTWTTGATNKIYRRYSQLFEFQLSLIAQFPVQGGKKNPEDRTLPFLPGKKLFGRSHVRDVAEERLVPITEYLQSLVSLAPEVSASQIVTNFFEPTDEDIKPIRERHKRSVRGEANEISDPILLEQWVCIGDFEKGKRTECSLKEGEVVDVIEKKASGWWFVDNGGNKGWAPASYLESLAGKQDNEVEKCAPGDEEEYITNNSYIAQSPDELGFDRGVVILVLQKNYDGWWLCRYQRREGLIPAAYLETNTQEVDRQDDKRSHATLPASASSNLINSKADSPTSKSVKHNYKSIEVKPTQPAIPTGLGTAVTQQFIPRRHSVRQTSVRKRKERETLGSFDKTIPEGRIDLYVALSDYEATQSDGLSFKQGDTIEVIDKQDSGWWWGTLGGRDGWVPASYLERSGGETGAQERNLKSKRCTAKEQFTGNAKDTLSFRAGEVFELIEKSDTGWWYLQNQAGQEGWAPEDLLTEGVKKQAPPSPNKPLPQSMSANHLSSVNGKPSLPVSRSFNSDPKAQLKPVSTNKPTQPDKPVIQNTLVTKPDKPVFQNTQVTKPDKPVIQNTQVIKPDKPVFQNTQVTKPDKPVIQNTQVTKPDKPVIQNTQVIKPDKPVFQNTQVTKPDKPVIQNTQVIKPDKPVFQNTQVTKPDKPVFQNTLVTKPDKPVFQNTLVTKPDKPVIQNTQVTKPDKPVFQNTQVTKPDKPVFQNTLVTKPDKPVFQNTLVTKPDKPVIQNTQVTKPDKPVLPSRHETASKPEIPVLPTNNRNSEIQNSYKAIKIGSVATDKPVTPGKPSYSKVKIGAPGVESYKPSLPTKPRQAPPSENKPLVTSKPKPEEGSVQNELASMLAKRLQTSAKPNLSASNKPSRPLSQEITAVKPVTGAQKKLSEPVKPVLPSRPNRPSVIANKTTSTDSNNTTNSTNSTNSTINSASSKYTTTDDNRAYEEGCLSFRSGESAELIERGDSGWLWMRIRKDEGWVFKDKVKLERGAPPIPENIGPVALEDFRAEHEGSISFKKGDSLQIVETDSGSGWTWVRVGKKEGWVPTDMISECK